MSQTFWRQMHGGSTPLPIVLLLASVAFGFIAWRTRDEAFRGGPPAAGVSSNLPTATLEQRVLIADGQKLFLKNCAHCHGADARGDDGPDLHNLDWTDEQIAARIRNGKKGQMPAFAGKFSADDIGAVIAYLRTLK